jgi:hypothetical protein
MICAPWFIEYTLPVFLWPTQCICILSMKVTSFSQAGTLHCWHDQGVQLGEVVLSTIDNESGQLQASLGLHAGLHRASAVLVLAAAWAGAPGAV